MDHATLAFALVFGALQIYAVMASIDLGAGALYLWGKLTRQEGISQAVLRYMSPIWEVTGVFLIFFVVSMVAFFPPAAGLIANNVVIPAAVATGLMVIRGVTFAMAHFMEQPRPWMNWAFAISSVLIPLFLVPFFTFMELGQAALWHPFTGVMGGLALIYLLALASTFLAFWSTGTVAERFATVGRYANLGLVPGLAGLVLVIARYAPYHYEALLRWWPALAVSLLLPLVSSWAVRRQRGLAVGTAILSLVLPFATFGFSRLPLLVYPDVTVYATLTSATMFTYLSVAFATGALITVPGLLWLLYTVMTHQEARP